MKKGGKVFESFANAPVMDVTAEHKYSHRHQNPGSFCTRRLTKSVLSWPSFSRRSWAHSSVVPFLVTNTIRVFIARFLSITEYAYGRYFVYKTKPGRRRSNTVCLCFNYTPFSRRISRLTPIKPMQNPVSGVEPGIFTYKNVKLDSRHGKAQPCLRIPSVYDLSGVRHISNLYVSEGLAHR